jgi:hypothetical protein
MLTPVFLRRIDPEHRQPDTDADRSLTIQISLQATGDFERRASGAQSVLAASDTFLLKQLLSPRALELRAEFRKCRLRVVRFQKRFISDSFWNVVQKSMASFKTPTDERTRTWTTEGSRLLHNKLGKMVQKVERRVCEHRVNSRLKCNLATVNRGLWEFRNVSAKSAHKSVKLKRAAD